MAYYLYDGKAAVGPFEAADLAKRPGFGAATMVCPVGAATADAWKPAGSFHDIAAALSPAIPAAPPPPPPPQAPGPAESGPREIILTPAPEPPPEPERPAPPPPVQAAPPVQPAAAGPALAAPADKLVMVIDDDTAIREFIEMIASGEGFQVVTAVNGLDAMKKLSARPVDLIVTDLMMPGQGGYEFLRSLQQEGGTSVPVFVVTASSLDGSTVNMIRGEANVVEFIAKPIRMPALAAALHKHLKTAPR